MVNATAEQAPSCVDRVLFEAPESLRPDFLGIGMHKTGTSWVHAMLGDHPDLFMAVNPGGAGNGKEFNYWSGMYGKTAEEYLEAFGPGQGKVKGEFSTSYVCSSEYLERIRCSLPKVKIVCGLRNPCYIFHSAYLHDRRSEKIFHGRRIRNIYEYYGYVLGIPLAMENNNMNRLLKDLNLFDSDNVFIYHYEELVRNPVAVMRSMYAFLGVDPYFVPSSSKRKVNFRYDYRFWKPFKLTNKLLRKVYGEYKGKRMLNTPELRPWWVSLLLRLNQKSTRRHTVSRAEMRFLRGVLAPICQDAAVALGKAEEWGFSPGE